MEPTEISRLIAAITEIIVGLSITKNRQLDSREKFDLRKNIQEVAKICEYHLRSRGITLKIALPIVIYIWSTNPN